MIEYFDTSNIDLLALKYEDVKLPDPKPQKTEEPAVKKQEEAAAEAVDEHEEHCCGHDHEEHEHHEHDEHCGCHEHEEHEHHHEHGEECGCGHHHHHHDHDDDECCGHEDEEHEHHHHEHDDECGGGHHHHHHDHDDDECCGHDHEGHEHHHHHHHDEPVEVSTHEDSVIATVRLGSLGRDKQAALVTLRSFMRAVAEETEGLGGMIGHIKFFLKESKGTMFSMTDLEEIQEKPAEGYEYTAEGVCIVLGIEPETLEEIVERHLPEKD